MTSISQRGGGALGALSREIRQQRGDIEANKAWYSMSGQAVRLAVEQQVMGALDSDHDGGMSLTELQKAVKSSGPGTDLAAQKTFFAQADADGNGTLTQGELRATSLFSNESLAGLIGAQGGEGVGGVLVSRADQDGDGKLSLDEYARISADQIRGTGRVEKMSDGSHRSVMHMHSDAEIRTEDFRRLDTDKDGMLSAQELNDRYVQPPGDYDPHVDAGAVGFILDAGDTDGDGALSLEELTAAGQKAGLEDFDAVSILEAGDSDKDGRLNQAEAAALRSDPSILRALGNGTAGEYSLARLAYAGVNQLGRDLAAGMGVLAAPTLRDPDASRPLYQAGDRIAAQDAAAVSASSVGSLRHDYDLDRDGALTLQDLSEAAKAFGLSTLDLTSMMAELDTDKDSKLSQGESDTLAQHWFMAAYRGKSSQLAQLTAAQATLLNILLAVQHGPRNDLVETRTDRLV